MTDPVDGDKRGGLSDMMKKAFTAGIGAVFMTEESVRSYVSEAKLPRDIAKYLIDSSGAAKEQLLQYVKTELGQRIRKADLSNMLLSVLESHELQIEAKVRFRPRSDKPVDLSIVSTHATRATDLEPLDDEVGDEAEDEAPSAAESPDEPEAETSAPE